MKRCLVILFTVFSFNSLFAQQLYRQPTRTSGTLYDLTFISDSDAIAIGSSMDFIGTSDKGSSWFHLLLPKPIGGSLYTIFFNDSANGAYAGDSGAVYVTLQSRTARLDLPEKKTIFDLTFPSYETAVLAGSQGLAYRSFDSGKTWTKMTLPLAARGLDFHGVDYFDDSTYWLVGQRGTVLYTEDAGATWQHVSVPTSSDLYSINFPDESANGWIVGDQTLLFTTDAGDHWTSVTTAANLQKVVGYDSLHAYACGMNGVLMATSDLRTWSSIPTGTTANLYGLDIPDSLYVCGDSGIILTTEPPLNPLLLLVRGATFKRPVLIGTSSEDTGIFIANITQAQPGDPAYDITVTGVTFDNPDFAQVTPFVQHTLAPGALISMKLKFTPSHTGLASGHVTITSLEAATKTALLIGYGVGADDVAESQSASTHFRIFDGIHTFFIAAREDESRLSIYNELGQCVSSCGIVGEDVQLPHELPPGFYFYKVSSNSCVRTGKLAIP